MIFLNMYRLLAMKGSFWPTLAYRDRLKSAKRRRSRL